MAAVKLPPQDFLCECFHYDPETGLFRWKHRPDHHFDADHIAQSWNSRFAGTPAFVTPSKEGYMRGEVVYQGRRHRMGANRVAWKMLTGEEHEMIDHRDLDVTNDRFVNLRASDKMGNRHNAPGHRNHLLPKGVSFAGRRFAAKGFHKGEKHHLGTFSSPAEAHEAYCAWARPIHGEFFNAGPAKPSVFD